MVSIYSIDFPESWNFLIYIQITPYNAEATERKGLQATSATGTC